MSPIENILFVIIFTGAIAFFLKNVFRLVATICLGRPENRFDTSGPVLEQCSHMGSVSSES